MKKIILGALSLGLILTAASCSQGLKEFKDGVVLDGYNNMNMEVNTYSKENVSSGLYLYDSINDISTSVFNPANSISGRITNSRNIGLYFNENDRMYYDILGNNTGISSDSLELGDKYTAVITRESDLYKDYFGSSTKANEPSFTVLEAQDFGPLTLVRERGDDVYLAKNKLYPMDQQIFTNKNIQYEFIPGGVIARYHSESKDLMEYLISYDPDNTRTGVSYKELRNDDTNNDEDDDYREVFRPVRFNHIINRTIRFTAKELDKFSNDFNFVDDNNSYYTLFIEVYDTANDSLIKREKVSFIPIEIRSNKDHSEIALLGHKVNRDGSLDNKFTTCSLTSEGKLQSFGEDFDIFNYRIARVNGKNYNLERNDRILFLNENLLVYSSKDKVNYVTETGISSISDINVSVVNRYAINNKFLFQVARFDEITHESIIEYYYYDIATRSKGRFLSNQAIEDEVLGIFRNKENGDIYFLDELIAKARYSSSFSYTSGGRMHKARIYSDSYEATVIYN